mmetsp:Transcript_32605/g.102462  ORF Transcript_32605/g.102462 Transcript_32605/m.102462 type:complete len:206 (+) Transcript_32605:855-1472(+)
MLPFAHTTRRTRTGRSEKKQPCLQFAGSWGYVRKSQHTDSHSRMAFLCVLVPVRGAPVPCQCLCYARGRFAASPRWDLCGLLVPVRAPVRCLKRKKESREPKEGWEDGTPPPHRDFHGNRKVCWLFFTFLHTYIQSSRSTPLVLSTNSIDRSRFSWSSTLSQLRATAPAPAKRRNRRGERGTREYNAAVRRAGGPSACCRSPRSP